MNNWVVTIHWPMSIEKRIYTAFEEAFEFACMIKKTVPENRVTLKRERREFEYWLSIILESAQPAT